LETSSGGLFFSGNQPLPPRLLLISISGLQSIPGDLKYKDAAAMLEVQTREVIEEVKACFHNPNRPWPTKQ